MAHVETREGEIRENRHRTKRSRSRSRSRGRRSSYRSEDSSRAIYVGNVSRDSNAVDLENMFSEFGKVTSIDMKSEYAFVFMASGHNDAIKNLDGIDLHKRQIRVQWSRGTGKVKRREQSRRYEAETRPSTTLFVVNFPAETEEVELRRIFEPFGNLRRCNIRNNYCFVEYTRIDDAIRAKKEVNGSDFRARPIVVEYQTDRSRASESNSRRRSRSGSPRSRRSYEDDYSYRRRPGRSRSRSRSRSRRRSPRYDRYQDSHRRY